MDAVPSESVTERSLIRQPSDDNWEVEIEGEISVNDEVVVSVPKDGRLAWTVCAAGFTLQVLIVGMLHVFGVFFVEFVKEFKKTKGEIAWIGSATYGLSMTFGPVTGILVNRYGNRPVTMAGCLLCSVSALISSFIQTPEMLFITYSLLYGIGTSLAYTPTMTIAQDYFERHVSLATGIMTAGSSTGTLILAPLTQYVVDGYGWRVAFRCFAVTCFLTVFCAMLFRPIRKRPPHPVERIRKSPLSKLMQELRLWKNRVFIVWASGITLVMFGYYIPYVHLVSYAKDVGVPPDQGSMLVMLLGGSTAVGRIMFGKIVQYGFLDRLHMHQLSMVITGTAAMLLPLITSFPGLAAYVICVGLVDGCFVVLLPLMTAALVGSDKTVIAWGFLVGASSITFTLGPPVAGWINDYTGSYKIAFHVAGVPIILGALILFLIPWAQRTSTQSNVLKVVNIEAPTNSSEPETIKPSEDTPMASPMCGIHPTSITLNSSSRCFSISSINSIRNVSLMMGSTQDNIYQPLTEETPKPHDTNHPQLNSFPSPLPLALSKLKNAAMAASSLPANLNLPLLDLGATRNETEQPTSSNLNKKSSATLRKELLQTQKELMIARGRVRAKSWSASGQTSRGAHLPQETRSDQNRDLISFETRSQLTVDNTDRLHGVGGRGRNWRGQTSSSDMAQGSIPSDTSSDRNYMADVSRQPSENSLVQMFDTFGLTTDPNNTPVDQGNASTERFLLERLTLNQDNLSSSTSALTSPSIESSQPPLRRSPRVDVASSEDESCVSKATNSSHLSLSSSPISSQEKLPTIKEHDPFHKSDSTEALSDVGRIADAVTDLVQFALIPSSGEG